VIVADANLIAAYCINTTATPAAKAIFAKDGAWISPKLWQAEFVSALLKHRRTGAISYEEFERSLLLAASLMRDMDYDSDVRRVAEVAERTSCSAYDACYVALAEEKDVRLVTKDGGILANASHVSMTPERFLAA
jgi:predicted nucleic acid-binding protein